VTVKTLRETASISSEYRNGHKTSFCCSIVVVMHQGSTVFKENVGKI